MDTKVLGAELTHQCPENLLQRRELHQLLNHPFSHGWVIFRRKSLLVALRAKIIAPAKVAQPLQGPVGNGLQDPGEMHQRAVCWGRQPGMCPIARLVSA